MTAPPAAVGDTPTRVMLAVASRRRPTVREVAAAAGVAASTAHHHLTRLRADGLVAWEPGRHGTLRATVAAYPAGRQVAGRGAPVLSVRIDDPELWQAIDDAAAAAGVDRSEWVRRLIRSHLRPRRQQARMVVATDVPRRRQVPVAWEAVRLQQSGTTGEVRRL